MLHMPQQNEPYSLIVLPDIKIRIQKNTAIKSYWVEWFKYNDFGACKHEGNQKFIKESGFEIVQRTE